MVRGAARQGRPTGAASVRVVGVLYVRGSVRAAQSAMRALIKRRVASDAGIKQMNKRVMKPLRAPLM